MRDFYIISGITTKQNLIRLHGGFFQKMLLGSPPEFPLAFVAVSRRDEPELLAAVVAGVRLFPGMSSSVRSKLVALSKTSAAVCALVRLLTGMNPLVGDAVLSLQEELPAVGALLALVAEVGAAFVTVSLSPTL
jgi:hypothetical protein